jgi:ketosteroid isomerase-like protein
VSENLDLVRSIYADWERGDFSRIDWADPGIEFAVHGALYPVRAKGLAEMAASVREVFSEIDDWHDVAEEYRELDANRVLVLGYYTGRGRASGVDLTGTPQRAARVFEIHDGKVTRMHAYWDRDRALADLGLEDG